MTYNIVRDLQRLSQTIDRWVDRTSARFESGTNMDDIAPRALEFYARMHYRQERDFLEFVDIGGEG